MINQQQAFSLRTAALAEMSADAEMQRAFDISCKFLCQSLQAGGKALICGNGGSAADAQHMAAELMGRFKIERKPLPAICLSTDTSYLTAVANDYGYEWVFSRAVDGLGEERDILFAFTTSGSSPNISNAITTAVLKNIPVVLLTSSKYCSSSDEKNKVIVIKVPSKDTPVIQEMHTTLLHMMCEQVDMAYPSLFKSEDEAATQATKALGTRHKREKI